MKLTARQLVGEILKWFSNPDALKLGAVIEALNNTQEEIQVKLSEGFNEKLERIDYIDLISGKDLYPLPDAVSDITKMERLDIVAQAVPVVRVMSKRDDFSPGMSLTAPLTYVLMPERQLRFIQVPTADYPKGARVTFNPRVTPLRNMDDVPALPEEIHECLVPLAVARLAGMPGANLANQQVFVAYAARLDKMFLSWCYPSDRERASDIEEESSFYQPEVF